MPGIPGVGPGSGGYHVPGGSFPPPPGGHAAPGVHSSPLTSAVPATVASALKAAIGDTPPPYTPPAGMIAAMQHLWAALDLVYPPPNHLPVANTFNLGILGQAISQLYGLLKPGGPPPAPPATDGPTVAAYQIWTDLNTPISYGPHGISTPLWQVAQKAEGGDNDAIVALGNAVQLPSATSSGGLVGQLYNDTNNPPNGYWPQMDTVNKTWGTPGIALPPAIAQYLTGPTGLQVLLQAVPIPSGNMLQIAQDVVGINNYYNAQPPPPMDGYTATLWDVVAFIPCGTGNANTLLTEAQNLVNNPNNQEVMYEFSGALNSTPTVQGGTSANMTMGQMLWYAADTAANMG